MRGIKAGLPLIDCLQLIATEAQEPVRSEFRTIVETQALGMPLGEAVSSSTSACRCPEANFFGIVIVIQQKRRRQSLGGARQSFAGPARPQEDEGQDQGHVAWRPRPPAAIIGALPIAVMALVYLTSPQYIELLWTDPLGNLMLAGSALWMTIGILVMRKMINFDF